MKKTGASSMESVMVAGFVMLISMVVSIAAREKQKEAEQQKTFLDAQRICHSVAANINTTGEQGGGYYLYFSVQDKLYGGQDQDMCVHK